MFCFLNKDELDRKMVRIFWISLNWYLSIFCLYGVIGGYFWFNVLLLNDIIDLIGDINDIILIKDVLNRWY